MIETFILAALLMNVVMDFSTFRASQKNYDRIMNEVVELKMNLTSRGIL